MNAILVDVTTAMSTAATIDVSVATIDAIAASVFAAFANVSALAAANAVSGGKLEYLFPYPVEKEHR